MRTRHQVTLTLFTGLLFTFVALAPTSALAQRTAETVESAPERTKMSKTAKAPTAKSGHTPATTIENSNGNAILQTSEGGSLLAPGLGGAIPAEGSGARMMWYPGQQAFRAGEVGTSTDGNEWDADSIGAYSVAFGDDTNASGGWAMAFGDQTDATTTEATAWGFETKATERGATAMGFQTIAKGFQSVAMGDNTEASGDRSVAMGTDTEASESNAVAMGTLSKARAANAVAMGFDAFAGASHSLAAGRCNNSTTSLFVVGNGTLNSAGDACDSFSDALELDANGDMEIAGTLTESSDRRLKTAIEPLGEGTLRKLSEIDPVRFRFKNEKTHPASVQIGLIAQEVQNQFPELVDEGSNGYLSLSYTKFSAVLLKGLQQQQSQLDEKTEKIADLNAEIEAINNQQDQLKQRLATLEAQTESGSILAGWTGSGFLAVLLALGIGLGAGLLWRGRVVVREAQSL